MAIILGDSAANTIPATSSDDTIFGFSGFDTLSTTFERGDLRGGWGRDTLTVDYSYTVAGAGPHPQMRWALSGDQGNDTITTDVMIGGTGIYEDIAAFEPLSAQTIVDGGIGNDTIDLQTVMDIDDAYSLLIGDVGITHAVVDLFGDNTISIESLIFSIDAYPVISNTVLLGRGDDDVTITGISEANNNNGDSFHDIDLGDGDNILTLSDVAGRITLDLLSGEGADDLDIDLIADEGNAAGFGADVDIGTGGGDDTLSLIFSGQITEYGNVDVTVDLGSGDNIAEILDSYGGQVGVSAGDGDDTVSVFWSLEDAPFDSAGSDPSVGVDAGDGDNIVSVVFGEYDTFSLLPFASITTGNGNDLISVISGEGNIITSGGGEDSVTAGSGTDIISTGGGADEILIDRSIFDGRGFGDTTTERLTLTDFSLDEGDVVSLTGWTIPALGGGLIDDAGDLQALQTPAGDVLSFVQVGPDALLTLDKGAGEVAEILFQNLDISTPVLDPPLFLSGTNADDILTGGNNDDIIFLRRGDDTATGNEGADIFRFNAVGGHNRDGDAHIITDLDFGAGDEIVFNNFGAGWADDGTDPGNLLEYIAGSFDAWVADSIADLQELRDSGALTATALGGGTELAWTDNAGNAVSVNLDGILV